MGKSSPSAPTPPDPAETAAAQGAINRETAIAQARLNMFDEYTPYGSSIWRPIQGAQQPAAFTPPQSDSQFARDLAEYERRVEENRVYPERGLPAPVRPVEGAVAPGPAAPSAVPGEDVQRYSRTTTLDPAQQRIFDQQTGITGDLNELASSQIGRIRDATAQPFSYEGLPDAPVADAEARQQVIDSLYGQAQSRLDPRFQQDRRSLETRLLNQGIGQGTDAYREAFDQFGRTRNDAYSTALNSAIAGGGAEQSRLFGLQGNARERAIQERAFLRNMPLNEVAALMGTGPGIQNPTFSAAPQTAISPADLAGNTYRSYAGQLNNYNQELGADNAARGGLFGLAGAGLGGFLGGPGGSYVGRRLFGG